nr:hypothetical protein [Bacillaceae bacterium]
MGFPHPTREEISENPFPVFETGFFFAFQKGSPARYPAEYPASPSFRGEGTCGTWRVRIRSNGFSFLMAAVFFNRGTVRKPRLSPGRFPGCSPPPYR